MVRFIFFCCLSSIGLVGIVSGQKYVYVDTEYMLSQMNEYVAAQAELKVQTERWNNEIDNKKNDLELFHRALNAEKPLLSESMRLERLADLKSMENSMVKLQMEYFGPDGKLFNKQKELIQPLQDKIYGGVQKYAKEKGYDLIFDRSSGNQLLYINPKLDKSDEIMAFLGIVKRSTSPKKPKRETNSPGKNEDQEKNKIPKTLPSKQ